MTSSGLFNHVLAMVLWVSFFAQGSQTANAGPRAGTESQGHPANGEAVSQSQQGMISLQMMSALPNLPDISPPVFNDPDAQEESRRFNALMRDYVVSKQQNGTPENALNPYAGLAKSLQEKAREMAAQYESQDPRTIAVLEDAALVLFSVHDKGAAALLDQAIQLHEHASSGPSRNYLRDLKLRCNMEAMESAAPQLQSCAKALQVRSNQASATPLELASWLRTIGLASSYLNRQRSLEYLERSLIFYAKVPNIPAAFMAGEYRRLTILSLLLGDNQHAFQFNDLANHYLSRGDATARKAMVLNETLKAAAAIPTETFALENPSRPKLVPEQQKQFDESMQKVQAALQQYKAANEARPQDQVMNSLQLGEQLRGNLSQKDPASEMHKVSASEQRRTPESADCSNLDQGSAFLSDVTFIGQRQIGNLKARLASISSAAFFYISLLQGCPQPTASAGVGFVEGAFPVPGYGTMAHFKGKFTESIAPRKLTYLPGGGRADKIVQKQQEITDQYVESMKARTLAVMLALMPPQQQQAIRNLPRDAQEKAIQIYFADLQKKNPRQAEELKKKLQEDMQAQVRQSSEFKALEHNADQLKDTLQTDTGADAKPLAFLEMLKPGEIFVDIYEYRTIRQDATFGREQYLAVVSQGPKSAKKIQLGAAEPIESAINSFYDALNGGDPLAPTWKALQERIVRPILAALPPDTKRIWLSPDSSLLSVPFAALLLDMGIQTEVSIIPSPYDFVRVQSAAPPTSGGVLFVGNLVYGQEPLPFPSMGQTEEEKEVLSRAAANARLSMETLSGDKVKRPVVIQHLKQVRFLHLSTHGFLENPITQPDADMVLPGGVALSGANSGEPDSFLTAEEIRQVDLSTVELVTLSACDTAKGRTIEGQGLLGFQTAFMAGGARSLLFSLWKAPADQATTSLMAAFYEGIWKNHLSKAVALRQAQLQIRSNPRFADPRNWAGWVLVGGAW
jgi:CHAT domain-containing protein